MRTHNLFSMGALLAVSSLLGSDSPGIQELFRLDRLPALRQSTRVASVSSYDRTGGNDDGFSGRYSFVRKEGETLVLADLKGPGVIYRVWTPTPSDDLLEFTFDGEAQPRVSVKYRDLFLGKHPAFPRPLVGFGAGGYYCYVPLPFAKSCIVRIRAPKTQFYQINYALYGADTGLTTFDPNSGGSYLQDRANATELFSSAGQDITRFTAPPGAKLQVTKAKATVEPGAKRTLFATKKGGRIVGLRMTPAEAAAGKNRDLILNISFDGEAPAIQCPLGDFFGYAWGQPAMQSLLLGTAGSTNYCYFPMPFDRSATIEIASERKTPVELNAEILVAPIPRSAKEGKFYALWRRENPTRLNEPYTLLDTTGRGHLVGVVLQSQGFESGKTLFFEGDDQATIDGELTIHGTGSEDFFNGGWYDVPDRWEKRISFPLSGCLGYMKHLGRTGAYRLFLGDAPSYRQSLKQTIEHAGENNSILTDYCSVALFYSEKHPSAKLAPPPVQDRAVLDPQEVLFPAWWQLPIYAWSFENASLTRKKEKIGKEDVQYLSLRASGGDWFGPHFISFTCDLPVTAPYKIFLEAVKGPAQGIVQLYQDENPVGDPVDLYAESAAKSGRLCFGTLRLLEGKNNLMFKLVGKNEKSTALGLDLVAVVCGREAVAAKP